MTFFVSLVMADVTPLGLKLNRLSDFNLSDRVKSNCLSKVANSLNKRLHSRLTFRLNGSRFAALLCLIL